uniref:Uncharacterized protein n=1 Tax=Anser brachyrhynchus TaxID=132585 RepID=A0A8B9BB99_9AVES
MQGGKHPEIHLSACSQESLFPEQQNYCITGQAQPGTTQKALPKSRTNNARSQPASPAPRQAAAPRGAPFFPWSAERALQELREFLINLCLRSTAKELTL